MTATSTRCSWKRSARWCPSATCASSPCPKGPEASRLDPALVLQALRHGSAFASAGPGRRADAPRLAGRRRSRRGAGVARDARRDLSSEQLDVALTLAQQAAAARAARHARAAARIDPLTGILNHGAMQAALGEEVARAARAGTPLSVLMLDVDHFKRVNDTHGHVVGDMVLKRVAGALRSHSRPYDRVCRYGGDEFVVLLPAADMEDAVLAARRIRVGVGAAVADLAHLGIDVAVSAGVAQWREGSPPSALLQAADRALLDAKRDGRDAVRRAADPG
jgi:diguanylate cyclase (GGDEF)-like protein